VVIIQNPTVSQGQERESLSFFGYFLHIRLSYFHFEEKEGRTRVILQAQQEPTFFGPHNCGERLFFTFWTPHNRGESSFFYILIIIALTTSTNKSSKRTAKQQVNYLAPLRNVRFSSAHLRCIHRCSTLILRAKRTPFFWI